MNRAELITEVADLTGQPKTQVSTTLSAMLHSITGAIAKGEKVTLVGFGTFERRTRQARTGRNPRTLAPLRIPASKVPAFRAGMELKSIVNGKARQGNWSAPGAKAKKKSKRR
ncbi:MAG: HU family DNA-binding protein [Candidatus Obscuribacterales bacterium]|nr:HU family DNA-binding protein [Cyanobacteria bacterium HKST-UBA01]MCB9468523.1 HU family DNA-binding protein [Candidatus Obscuribacterales bacterium]